MPIQAFQADFNEKYLAYQALNERRGDDVNVRQLAALEQARTFALGALAALALIAVGGVGRRLSLGDRTAAAGNRAPQRAGRRRSFAAAAA